MIRVRVRVRLTLARTLTSSPCAPMPTCAVCCTLEGWPTVRASRWRASASGPAPPSASPEEDLLLLSALCCAREDTWLGVGRELGLGQG